MRSFQASGIGYQLEDERPATARKRYGKASVAVSQAKCLGSDEEFVGAGTGA
jgi:hypothetical protein